MINATKKLSRLDMRWILIAGLVAFAMGAMFLQGCSQSPLDTSNVTQDNGLTGIEALEQVINPDGPSTIRSVREEEPVPLPVIVGSACFEATFGPDGGSMSATIDDAQVVFSVPAGALSEDVVISICGYKGVDQFGKVDFIYECQPGGLEFALPATLTQDWTYGGTTVNSFFMSDDPFSVWTLEEVVPVQNDSISLTIDHFSKYGISN